MIKGFHLFAFFGYHLCKIWILRFFKLIFHLLFIQGEVVRQHLLVLRLQVSKPSSTTWWWETDSWSHWVLSHEHSGWVDRFVISRIPGLWLVSSHQFSVISLFDNDIPINSFLGLQMFALLSGYCKFYWILSTPQQGSWCQPSVVGKICHLISEKI